MEVPPGSAIITPAEMYREMQAIHQGVTEMRSEVREVMRVIPDHEERLRALEQREDSSEVQDHEDRLRSLERALWLVAGFAAGVGGVAGGIVTTLLGG